ncbi:arylsulfatase B-like [Sycon ciliatum]|uniref:arylsulfatase B-like n=1 Tax=Sycon ciliatum TaxID=27933 RepID=UPI0031F66C50
MWTPSIPLLCAVVLGMMPLACHAELPHIVFMLVDDWGWANVGYHRQVATKEVVTPTFDRLCKQQGLELDQHYAFKVCSPSRCSLMSGRLPVHVNTENLAASIVNTKDPVSGAMGIPRNMTCIAEKLNLAGYESHQVGKWDAGMATPDHTPKGRGFKTSLGYFHHDNDYWTEGVMDPIEYFPGCRGEHTDLWDTDRPAKTLNGTAYEEELFANRVLSIVNGHNASNPLFLYYAPHIAHTPLQVPKAYEEKFSFIENTHRRIYHAMVNYLDDVLAKLEQALIAKGMWSNTLMVVSSDNGGPVYRGGGGNNYPLKGGKASNFQGGVRVNAFVTGGFLPEKRRGQVSDGYIALADWYKTFCGLAGVDWHDEKAEKAKLPPVDGYDVWPLLSGTTTVSPRTEIPLNPGLISGDFKILVDTMRQAGWTGPQYPNNSQVEGIHAVQECGYNGCLYNIKEDPEERHDLAASMPDKAKEMRQRLDTWDDTWFRPDRGVLPSLEACKQVKANGGFFGPFLP